MATFQYKAATTSGEIVDGVLSGSTRAHVIEQLQSLGHVPIRVDESLAKNKARRKIQLRRQRVTEEQIGDVTRSLSTLLQAGLPLDRALAILMSLADSDPMKELLGNIRDRVKEGATLADAMEEQGSAFSRFYISLLRAGESGGALEVVMQRLADHMESAKEMRSTLTSALIYPAILVVVALLSIFILLGYVVPQFTQMFDGMGEALPLSTRITIAVGEGLQSWGWILVVLVAGAFWYLRQQLSQPASAYKWHVALLRMPLMGEIVVKMEVARFAHTLSTLLHNGIPLLKALTIVKETMGNLVLACGLERVAVGLKEGQSLADPLADVPHFPSFAVHMIRVGEESGELEQILQKVAETFDRDTQVTIKRTMSLLEPMLILVLGVVVAAVIISILVAILSINELVI
ncbi:MAG: type II secretion system F family protein [Woeseiaceae bacterium]|nr:type II secretion system F family protein [Woeseiaceae bacterium]